ncbi:DUF6173 family protein [Marinovum sp.]|uniref:DUF6173 family protein n=1 Tax=Marinovum sp. TaxID=2024839 RepID=UPI003A8E0B19
MDEHDISTTAEAYEAAALPRRIEVYPEDRPVGEATPAGCVTDKPVAQKSPAEWAYERLVLYIRDFEAELDNAHEVAMGFTGSQAGVLRIEGMGFFDPDIITFYGTDAEGIRTQLIQHVSQLSVLLRALPKLVEQEAPRRIGFRLAQRLEDATRDAAAEAAEAT